MGFFPELLNFCPPPSHSLFWLTVGLGFCYHSRTEKLQIVIGSLKEIFNIQKLLSIYSHVHWKNVHSVHWKKILFNRLKGGRNYQGCLICAGLNKFVSSSWHQDLKIMAIKKPIYWACWHLAVVWRWVFGYWLLKLFRLCGRPSASVLKKLQLLGQWFSVEGWVLSEGFP